MCLPSLKKKPCLALTVTIKSELAGTVKLRLSPPDSILNQRTNGPVNAHLISWPSKAQNIQNLENIW